jgi:hypothetical protein
MIPNSRAAAVAKAFHTRPRAVLAKEPFDHLP